MTKIQQCQIGTDLCDSSSTNNAGESYDAPSADVVLFPFFCEKGAA